MRILVTNDDGIDSPGLRAVALALHAAGHDLQVAAPATDRSGSGSSLGTLENNAEVPCERRELDGLPGVDAWAFDAPPSFAMLAMCTGAVGRRPELVVSGINAGFNTGRMLLSSSTVGAALTADALGVRAVAISSGFPPGHRFDTASYVACTVVSWMEHNERHRVLNVNVPDVDLDQIRGVKMSPLAKRGLMGLALTHESGHLRLNRFEQTERLGFDTDSAHVNDGFVSVSSLSNVGADGEADYKLEQELEEGLETLLH